MIIGKNQRTTERSHFATVTVLSSALRCSRVIDVPMAGKHLESEQFDVIIVLGTTVVADGEPSGHSG